MLSRVTALSFRAVSSVTKQFCTKTVLVDGYQSQYAIAKLYPSSNHDFNRPFKSIEQKERNYGIFDGHIPIDKLHIKYSRSSGPGGQNVNKVNTKVQVRFHVQSADWIPEQAIPKLLETEHGRITNDGFLIVSSEKTRKQMLNQADCMDKIRNMIWKALIVPKEPTEEELRIKEHRMDNAKRRILREKRTQSLKKQTRQSPGMDAV